MIKNTQNSCKSAKVFDDKLQIIGIQKLRRDKFLKYLYKIEFFYLQSKDNNNISLG